MKTPTIHKGLSILVVVLITGLFASCEKEKDSIGIIRVIDPAGDPVQNANVKVFGEPSDTLYSTREVDVEKDGKTDVAGEVKFKFNEYYKKGQAGLLVLDIEAKKDSLSGESYIEIVEGEKNKETVTIEP